MYFFNQKHLQKKTKGTEQKFLRKHNFNIFDILNSKHHVFFQSKAVKKNEGN